MATHVLADTVTLTGRTLTHVRRSPDTIITTALMPIAIMLLFGYVFGGAIRAGGEAGTGAYVAYLLPGILVMTVAMGVGYTAYRLFLDLDGGIVDRFNSMPVARPAILWAHVLTSAVACAVSMAGVLGVALLMGFRTSAGPLAWLVVAGVLGLLVLALTWVAVIAGLTASSVEGAGAFSYPLTFLPFVSSAFVPTDTMPGPLRWFAEHQPVTAIVDAIRDLFARRPLDGDIWVALGWCVGIALVAYAVAVSIYRRRDS